VLPNTENNLAKTDANVKSQDAVSVENSEQSQQVAWSWATNRLECMCSGHLNSLWWHWPQVRDPFLHFKAPGEVFKTHLPRKQKEGACFVPAIFHANDFERAEIVREGVLKYIPAITRFTRNQSNVRAMTAICLDYDRGLDAAVVLTKLRAMKLAFAYYTSYSNGKTQKDFAASVIERKYGPDVTLDNLKEHMAADHYPPNIVASVTGFSLETHEEKGKPKRVYLIDHAPMQKFRVVLPLSAPYEFPAYDTPEWQARRSAWAHIYHAVGAALGGHIDRLGLTIERGFYFPSYKEGSDAPRASELSDGLALDLNDPAIIEWLKPYIAAEEQEAQGKVAARKAPQRPKSIKTPRKVKPDASTALSGEHVEHDDVDEVTNVEDEEELPLLIRRDLPPSGPKYFRSRGLKLATLIQSTSKIAHDRLSARGTLSVECPFADYHSSGTDGAYVKDAADEASWPLARCSHTGCSDRLTEDFIGAWIEQKMLSQAHFSRFTLRRGNSAARCVMRPTRKKSGWSC
jgi:hypothetical protein